MAAKVNQIMDQTLNISNLAKSFGDQLLFKSVSFQLEKGDCCWISGENGVGKSTLLKCIAGVEPIQTGTISLNNQTITFLSENDWLYSQLTIQENLEFWATINNSQLNTQLLKDFSLSNQKHKKIVNISQGMRKKVALIRTLQNKASIVLLDEPYNFLDEKNVSKLNQIIKNITPHKIILIATHDQNKVSLINNKHYKIENQKIENQKDV